MIAPALGHGLSFNDLYDRDGLARLDAAFAGWLQTANVDVHARLMAARAAPDQLADKDESNLLIEVARPLEVAKVVYFANSDIGFVNPGVVHDDRVRNHQIKDAIRRNGSVMKKRVNRYAPSRAAAVPPPTIARVVRYVAAP